ncbi:unnamed protein product [Trifolium pratense]|uniref:Uncharacterized protein n=1 Tax=Trifolium pratense TaxID=57577 RepID=A0ACB0K6I7_TRIPR|nr:unnamed protein product [Trifolium pratense]
MRYTWFLLICFTKSLVSLNLTANLGSCYYGKILIVGLFSLSYHLEIDLDASMKRRSRGITWHLSHMFMFIF